MIDMTYLSNLYGIAYMSYTRIHLFPVQVEEGRHVMPDISIEPFLYRVHDIYLYPSIFFSGAGGGRPSRNARHRRRLCAGSLGLSYLVICYNMLL